MRLLALVGDAAEEIEDPASDGIEGLVGQAEPRGGIELFDGELAGDAVVVASSFWMRRSSSSNSSRISPTSSSSRSSRATRPAVPPYSSTTMARWSFLAWNSRRRASARLDSGTK